ncbi:MAG: hypothetical protein GY703_03135 [Gammaproteobacteria bacterium]|nr:hypothetical protein [Gammaproteobacteria bacterium]
MLKIHSSGKSLLLMISVLLLVSLTVLVEADTPTPTANPAARLDERGLLELGRKVLAVREAIDNPTAPGSMDAITDLGRDQRYYVMVRGWLAYQLVGDQSILETAEGQTRKRILNRIHFLKKGIRAIDLE